MNSEETANLGRISVVFESRSDGGLRVYCDDVPGFILSHADPDRALQDVKLALETIISEMMGMRVTVGPLDQERSLPWFPESRKTRLYEARRAA